MMLEFEEYEDLYHRAFTNYEKKLRTITNVEDIPDILKNDLTDNADKIHEYISRLHDIVNEGSRGGEFRKQLCLALCSYVDELEKSQNDIKDKMNGLNIEFSTTSEEIKTANDVRKQFCPNNWKPKT